MKRLKSISLFCSIFLFHGVFANHSKAGEIALTFDDAPMPSSDLMNGMERTEQIIQSLQSLGVKDATFFVTTHNIKDDVTSLRLQKYVDAGFYLANHSHSHRSANEISATEYLDDFHRSQEILKAYRNVLPIHRFPFLHYGENIEKRNRIFSSLAQEDVSIGYITVDNFDWYINDKVRKANEQGIKINLDNLKVLYIETIWNAIEFYDSLAVKTLDRSPKHVLLLHENDTSALFIGDLVKHIRSMGWKIISSQEAYSDPISKAYTPNFEFNKQGRIAAIAHNKGTDTEQLRHESENTDYIDKLFEDFKVFDN
ncbi:MAG: polysaccharide deacetylase family protein [Acidiferrobacterales bacterium]|nr:polysaccharide deacetylase family protein [Acidiferrobacterales bacterium]